MTTFSEKNSRRRTYYTGSNEHRSARLARRDYGGMFGSRDPEVYNRLVQGTSGEERN